MNENLPIEVPRKQFYIHKDYVPTYYYAYKFIKDYIAKMCLRNDISRVVMASNDYAFRRRFETTDMSTNYNDLETSSLNFPFANFWPQNSTIVPDDRFAAKTAALIYSGIEIGSTRVRAASVILSIPTTIYFDREDDARMCCEKLYFESYNEHYYSTKARYADNMFNLPLSIEVRNLTFNPQFNEQDWLKKQRIFPITVEFNVRTYILYPPQQPNYDVEILEDFSNYSPGFEHNYITEQVIMDFKGYEDILYSNIVVGDLYKDNTILVDQIEKKVTRNSATIKWVVNENSKPLVSGIRIIDLQDNSVVELPKESTYYAFHGLTENSSYQYLIEFLDGASVGASHYVSVKTQKTKGSSDEKAALKGMALRGRKESS